MNPERDLLQITVKPWGKEILVVVNEKYALKDITINKDTRSSLQSHVQKLETIYVIEGKILLEKVIPTGQRTVQEYGVGGVYTLLPGTLHRVTALENARLIEVSTPELSDLVRHEDDFGRK